MRRISHLHAGDRVGCSRVVSLARRLGAPIRKFYHDSALVILFQVVNDLVNGTFSLHFLSRVLYELPKTRLALLKALRRGNFVC